ARETLATAKPADAALLVQIRLATDASGQSAAVEDTVRHLAGDAPLDVRRSVRSPVGALLPDGSETTLLVLADAETPERATLTTGDWGAALHVAAAESLGLAVGDAVVFGDGTELEV